MSVSRTQCCSRCGDRAQQFVADMMAERIVDLLEAVEIEAEHRETAVAPGAGERFLDLLAEQDAVRQVRSAHRGAP